MHDAVGVIANEGAMAWALSEFGAARLGDARRTKRAVQVASDLVQRATASIPAAMKTWPSIKAAYNLFSNPAIKHTDLLSGAIPRTIERCASRSVVLSVQDTTSLHFGGAKRKGLGTTSQSTKRTGFQVHTALLVSKDDHEILGVAHQHAWVRGAKKPAYESSSQRKKRPRESEKWSRAAIAVGKELADRGLAPRVIQVCDREADIFEFIEECDRLQHGFVIRAAKNRLLDEREADETPQQRYLLDEVRTAPVVAEKFIEVPARPKRAHRVARLEVRVLQVSVCPPKSRERKGESLQFTIVLAIEVNPPSSKDQLVWFLLTREPVATPAEVLEVIRVYEARWLIEELHMAFKSGCATEARQLETAHGLMNFLAFATVIACQALTVRDAARRPEPPPATSVLRPQLLALLLLMKPRSLPANPTARDALRAIATLGGFIGRKRDGEPGWRTLWRGMERLLAAEAGYLLASPRSG